MSEMQNEEHGRPDCPKMFEIKIDRMNYKVSEAVLTGAQLRQ
ncbi:hypothetical protein [Mesorhizobium sp. M0060]